MKTNEQLTHREIMDGLTDCFRDLISHEVSDRNMPNRINKGKAAAALVTAMHREQIMESKRLKAVTLLTASETTVTKDLKKLN